MTNDQIGWLIEMSVRADRLGDWRELMGEMVESTRAEPGTLVYEWMQSSDGSTCQLVERYASVAAALAHGRSFDAKFAERFFAWARPTRLTVYGTPNAELRASFAALSPTYLAPVGGFDRADR